MCLNFDPETRDLVQNIHLGSSSASGPEFGHFKYQFSLNLRHLLLKGKLSLYYSDDQIYKTELGRACSTHGERKGVYRVLVAKPEGRRPLERPSRRWEVIKVNLLDVTWEAWTGSIWLRTGTGGGLL